MRSRSAHARVDRPPVSLSAPRPCYRVKPSVSWLDANILRNMVARPAHLNHAHRTQIRRIRGKGGGEAFQTVGAGRRFLSFPTPFAT